MPNINNKVPTRILNVRGNGFGIHGCQLYNKLSLNIQNISHYSVKASSDSWELQSINYFIQQGSASGAIPLFMSYKVRDFGDYHVLA